MKQENNQPLSIRVQNDPELKILWDKLSRHSREHMTAIYEKQCVPDFLSDTIFKGIFNPSRHSDNLSNLISSILGRPVKILQQLSGEGIHHSAYSKGIILDIVVQFEDGSIANVEIQRLGIHLPPQRAAIYSGDLLRRQYSIEDGSSKADIDYTDIKPVYTIILMEHSPSIFLASGEYRHHFEQTSNTGVKLELLQYYDYICLDVFSKANPSIAGELERWLHFLNIRNPLDMSRFLNQNPSFQPIYECAIMMTKDRKELLSMFSDLLANEDVVASINRTNASTIKILEHKLDTAEEEAKKALVEKDAALAEKDAALAEKDAALAEKDAALLRIAELESALSNR